MLTLVDRTSGEARSVRIDKVDACAVVPIVRQNIAREATVVTDEASHYNRLEDEYGHETVNHAREEWVRGEIHTHTIEGYFSIFKRGMKGVYQHCSEKHLHRYLAEFDFRYSNRSALGVEDLQRAVKAVAGAKGKRLTHKQPDGAMGAGKEAAQARR